MEVDGDEVISAGIPWYSTVFGRDAIITSIETLALNPGIARDTLRYLARRQGVREDPFTEEQPGRILHELRRGEMARSGEIPHVPYYGSIDATPLWLVLLHETWRWTGDTTLVRELLPAAERALSWMDRYGDLDGDGFVEYARTSDKGLVNQGWKDSGDGVPNPDGTLPAPPIALVEVQGYVHDAKVRTAELFQIAGRLDRAAALRREAAELRDRIRTVFWDEDLGTFALALDGAKRPVPTATTNAGHLLWSRVPTVAQGERLRERFLQSDFFSGWGVRTLSAAHPVFNPMSYHDGSVWPHDNALLVLGLALYGHARAALPIVRAVYEAGAGTQFQRLPELYCGMSRGTGRRPVGYPVSCSPQAWASGALFMMLQALLGLYPDAPTGVLHVRDPVLPDFLDHLTLEGLCIGNSRVALQFRRHGSRTLANLLGIEGTPLQVRIELS
jgi:glycogen debranching enzyme